ncbi:MAG: hypothetical protein OXC00_07945, partial [Acidimicrobiaceae bacterium]|nr:hypothetical protein [Acidimicrobiaceae bacterium]
MRLSPSAVLRYALAVLVVVGVPAAAVLLLGTPEPALPSDWGDARARIDGGTFPASYVVDIVSAILLLAWMAGVWFVVTRLRKQAESTSDETDAPFAPTADDDSAAGGEPDEPWYRQGPPIFDEPFSDEYQRVVVPPDEPTPGDEPQDSVWQPAPMTPDDEMQDSVWPAAPMTTGDRPHDSVWPEDAMTTEAGDGPLGMFQPDALDEDIAEAEIIGGAGTSGSAGMTSGEGGPSPDDPPMIVPVRAYYFTRAEDTLRSISAQFLNTPTRWEELRSLNAASPGVSTMGPDSLLPVGTALALPGDPLPWGKPDPVYLWTLAEKFLFTAWGREPTPEEVAPFWRGLTSGAQLEAGAPPTQPEHLPAAAFTEPPTPEIPTEPAAAFTEPPTPEAAVEEALTEPAEPPAEEALTEPPPEVPTEPAEPPVPDEFVPVPPAASGFAPTVPPTDLQPPAEVAPPAYESPVPPTHAPAAFQPTPPAYETPAPPTHEPTPHPAYEAPVPPSHEAPPPAYEAPVPPSHEAPPPAYDAPAPPPHEPPPPAYDAPAPPTHEPPP